MRFEVAALLALLITTCAGKSIFETEDEASVVSIYTTQPTTTKTAQPLDVYNLIANNIAQRITSPIYKFLGIGKNKTEATTPMVWQKLELDDDEARSVDDNNALTDERDVEELSVEALRRPDKKPEKIVLYSSYLPDKSSLTEKNSTNDDDDDDFDDDPIEFDEEQKPREGGWVYFLELFGSFIQLAWGALLAFFKPSNNS